MKNTNKGFTLVELIVVITILAILGTIAFISLQGYSQDAKNSKVTSDIRNLVSAIETDATKNSTPLANIVTSTGTSNEVSGTSKVGNGIDINNTSYAVGNIDFAAIRQNGTDFKDPNNNDSEYIFAYTSTGTFSAYQIAGKIIENNTDKVRINGNYFKLGTGDTNGIISATGSSDTGLVDGDSATLY